MVPDRDVPPPRQGRPANNRKQRISREGIGPPSSAPPAEVSRLFSTRKTRGIFRRRATRQWAPTMLGKLRPNTPNSQNTHRLVNRGRGSGRWQALHRATAKRSCIFVYRSPICGFSVFMAEQGKGEGRGRPLPPRREWNPAFTSVFRNIFFFPRSRRRKERGGGGEVENNFLILDWIGKFDESVESKLNFLSWRRRGVERWIISYFERGNNFKLFASLKFQPHNRI